jgi:hypothetical protein
MKKLELKIETATEKNQKIIQSFLSNPKSASVKIMAKPIEKTMVRSNTKLADIPALK